MAKNKNVDIKSRRCRHCNGTELVCRLHKQCCELCGTRGKHENMQQTRL